MTTIDTTTKTRLQWLAGELQKLYDNGWLRYDGEPVFRGAQQELADLIATAQAPTEAAPQIVQTVMTEEQVRTALAALLDLSPAVSAEVVAAIRDEIERSDATVLAAVAETRADVLAAVTQPAAQ
jgi:hypothetical protein